MIPLAMPLPHFPHAPSQNKKSLKKRLKFAHILNFSARNVLYARRASCEVLVFMVLVLIWVWVKPPMMEEDCL